MKRPNRFAPAAPPPPLEPETVSPRAGSRSVAAVEAYLARFEPRQRAALEDLRRVIRASAPQAEECLSYGIAAFRQNGMLVGLGATPKHCAFYLMSDSTVARYSRELAGFSLSKGTIRFQPEAPPSATLVRLLVKARLDENNARKA